MADICNNYVIALTNKHSIWDSEHHVADIVFVTYNFTKYTRKQIYLRLSNLKFKLHRIREFYHPTPSTTWAWEETESEWEVSMGDKWWSLIMYARHI